MDDFNLIVALLGASILLLGLASKRLTASALPPTLLALLLGILVGPAVLGLVDPARLGDTHGILEHATRLTLGIGLVGVALRVPRSFPRRSWQGIGILVGAGMLLMWTVSTLLVYLVLDLSFWLAALIGAMITPTDPIAASAIVTGHVAERNIPARLRHTISFESGVNDGLSYLFVFLSFLMLTRSAEEAVVHWLLHTLLAEVVVAMLLGGALGYLAGKLLHASELDDAIESDWRLVYTVAVGLLAIGAGRLVGSDEILAAFTAGAAFVQVVSGSDRAEEEHGQEAVNRFFAIPIFALIGTALPWNGWWDLGWHGLVLAAAVLLLRRPPVILLLRPFLRDVRSVPEALFVGWFGPVAVAATYYASLLGPRLGEPVVWDVISLIVFASAIAHGLTGAPVTRWLGRTVEAGSIDAPSEERSPSQ